MGCNVEITMCGKIFQNGIERKPHVRKKDGCNVISINNKLQYVHRLVAEKYIPNPDNKPEVNHLDGNRSNNNVLNLVWSTKKENLKHARDTKLWGKNIIEKRKLTDDQADEIKKKYIPRKYTMIKLANEYSVDYKTINDILNNKTYIKRKEDYFV